MDFIKNNKRWIGIGSCVLAIIGNFLPFYSIVLLGSKRGGISFFEGDGKIAVGAFVAAAILMYLKKDFKIILGVLAIGIGITIYDGLNITKIANAYYGSISLSVGFYLIIIGGLLAFLVQFIKGEETVTTANLSNQGFVSYNTQPVQQNTINNQSTNNMGFIQSQYNTQPTQQQGFNNQYAQSNNQQQMNWTGQQQYYNQAPAQQPQYNNQQMNQGFQQQYGNQQMMNQGGQNQYPNPNQYPNQNQ